MSRGLLSQKKIRFFNDNKLTNLNKIATVIEINSRFLLPSK